MTGKDHFFPKNMEELEKHPDFQETYNMVYSILGVNEDEESEVDAFEIDGTDYFVFKEFVIQGTTYYHLVNEKDPFDFLYRKLSIQDGEEYLVGLDSDQEFDRVIAYEQKYILRDLKRKQEWNTKKQDE